MLLDSLLHARQVLLHNIPYQRYVDHIVSVAEAISHAVSLVQLQGWISADELGVRLVDSTSSLPNNFESPNNRVLHQLILFEAG